MSKDATNVVSTDESLMPLDYAHCIHACIQGPCIVENLFVDLEWKENIFTHA